MKTVFNLGVGFDLNIRKDLPMTVFGKAGAGKTYIIDKLVSNIKEMDEITKIEGIDVVKEEDVYYVLARLEEIGFDIKKRQAMLKIENSYDISVFNSMNENIQMVRKYVVLDGYVELLRGLKEYGEEYEERLERVLKTIMLEGRLVGVNIIIAGTDSNVGIDPTALFLNARTNTALKLDRKVEYEQIFGETFEEEDWKGFKHGDCYFDQGAGVQESKII